MARISPGRALACSNDFIKTESFLLYLVSTSSKSRDAPKIDFASPKRPLCQIKYFYLSQKCPPGNFEL